MGDFKEYINKDLVEASGYAYSEDSKRKVIESVIADLESLYGRGNIIYDETDCIHIELGTHFVAFCLHDNGKVTLSLSFDKKKDKASITKELKGKFQVKKVGFRDDSEPGDYELYRLDIEIPYTIYMSKEEVTSKLEKLVSGTSLMQIILNSDRTDLASYFLSDDFCKEEYKKFRDAAKKLGITDEDVRMAFQ